MIRYTPTPPSGQPQPERKPLDWSHVVRYRPRPQLNRAMLRQVVTIVRRRNYAEWLSWLPGAA